MARLGVNIDHIATVRQARRTFEPDPVNAVGIVERAGAYGIVCHLREDRRHISDRDLRLIRQVCQSHLNLELAADEVIAVAREVGPDTCTLVPERREEVTTEGGLDVAGQLDKLKRAVERLSPIPASAFINPEEAQIMASLDAGFTAVELHTGEYANARPGPEREEQLARLAKGAETAAELGLYVAAGHGLTYINVAPVAELGVFAEFNIGHSIIARAVFTGLEEAVREMALLVG
jgi:pyridoxine 5-phosphate synthase